MPVSSRVIGLLALAYAAALVYGSIYPLQGWRPPSAADLGTWLSPWDDLSFSDLATNAIVYVPLGVLLALALHRRGPATRIGTAFMSATLLSGAVEIAQLALPFRVSSPLDWALNVAGATVAAALTPVFLLARRPGQAWRLRRVSPLQWMALATVALWVGGEWHPFVPSINPLSVWQGIKPLWLAWQQPMLPTPWNAAADMAEPVAVAMLLQIACHGHLRNRLPVYAFLPAVLVVKVLVVSRSVDTGDLLGAMAGMLALAALSYGRVGPARAGAGIALVLLAITLRTVSPEWTDTPRTVNWIPLRAHLQNPLVGIGGILESGWYAMSMVTLLAAAAPRNAGAVAAGGAMAVIYAAALEWLQRWQINRVPDVTEILLIALFVTLAIIWWHGQATRHTIGESGNAGEG